MSLTSYRAAPPRGDCLACFAGEGYRPVRDAAVWDAAVWDAAVRDAAVRDGAVRDAPVRDDRVWYGGGRRGLSRGSWRGRSGEHGVRQQKSGEHGVRQHGLGGTTSDDMIARLVGVVAVLRARCCGARGLFLAGLATTYSPRS